MLGFEIGQRESGFYSERRESLTDRQNHRITEPSNTVLVFRLWRDGGQKRGIRPTYSWQKRISLILRGTHAKLDKFERTLVQMYSGSWKCTQFKIIPFQYFLKVPTYNDCIYYISVLVLIFLYKMCVA